MIDPKVTADNRRVTASDSFSVCLSLNGIYDQPPLCTSEKWQSCFLGNHTLNCLSLKDADSLIVLSGPCDNLGATLGKYVKLPKILDMVMQLN